MRLSRPVYEGLPYFYVLIGALAVTIFYIDHAGARGKLAFILGCALETAALTVLLRRVGYRALIREYSGELIELPDGH